MEASTALGAPIRIRPPAPVLARLGRVLAVSTIVLVAATGLLVGARRATGALVEPLAPGVLAGLGIVLAALAVGFRKSFVDSVRPSGWRLYLLWAAPSAALVFWAASVSLADSDTWGLAVLLGALLLEEGFSWGRLRRDMATRDFAPPLESPAARDLRLAPSVATPEVPPADFSRDQGVSQSMIRRQDEAGDAIEGCVRVDFAASQRHAAAHVAICPPMEGAPQCFAEQTDGPSATVKVAEVQSYGARFDVRLDRPAAEPVSVLIEFSIQGRPAEPLRE